MKMRVPLVEDFELLGTSSGRTWESVPWHPLTRVTGGSTYQSRFKLAWSTAGIYGLADFEDETLTCQHRQDFDDIFHDDVVEAFFWPAESRPLYLEYELSPLGRELPILVPNDGGSFMGWRPWHYEGDRKTRTATHVCGGPAEPGATVTGWSAEFFIPFTLFRGIARPASVGDCWRANIYRIDYDQTPSTQWAWCPDTGGNFHWYERFGTIEFGPRLD